MPRAVKEWEITCDGETFKNVRRNEKFPYVVALARSVNALNSAHSLLMSGSKSETPERVRNTMNSYFFAGALLYEGLGLVRKMIKPFADDIAFQNGLRMILRNPVAQKIEQMHLNPARNHAVFHFLPDEFEKAIGKSPEDRNVFVVAIGKKKKSLHYAYADVLVAEMSVGLSSDDPAFWPSFDGVVKETTNLVIKFASDAEDLIGSYLKSAGFRRE
jgi:hypothetical protein